MVKKIVTVFEVGDITQGIIPDQEMLMKIEKLVLKSMLCKGDIRLFLPPYVKIYDKEMMVPELKEEKDIIVKSIKDIDKNIKEIEDKTIKMKIGKIKRKVKTKNEKTNTKKSGK
jgi:hypothetical protein